MKMPFGKHRGVDVSDLPNDYLIWLAEGANLFGPLRLEVQREYVARLHRAEPRNSGATVRIADVEIVRLVVNHGYRATAKLFHPDTTGGDAAMMTRLNAVVESLRSQLAALEAV
jgi:hypothetical protein